MSTWVTVDIRRLERGEYLAKVNKRARVFPTFMEAATWAVEQMEAMGEPPDDPRPTK